MPGRPGLAAPAGSGAARVRAARRPVRLLAIALRAGLVLAGGSAVLAAGGTAWATGCGSPVAGGSSCSLTGTLTLAGGPLTLTTPSALAWSGVLNGSNENLYDSSSSDEAYVVDDATASGAGWNVTVSATQFSTGGAAPRTLPNSGTLSTNGSLTSASATTAPSAACNSGVTCTLPSNSTAYPVPITTAPSSPSAVKIFDDAAAAGIGEMTISNIGWWITVPANTAAGTYTATFTFEVNSAP